MSQSVITFEGTVTPSTFLSTGERRTVTWTPFIEKLIAKGFVRVVGVVDESPAVSDMEVAVPAKNAKREVWKAFLEFQDVPFPDNATRDDMVKIWYADHGQTDG